MGIDRPRTGSDHCQRCSKNRECDWHPCIPAASQDDPELDDCDERTRNGGQEACHNEDSQDCSSNVQRTQRGRGFVQQRQPAIEQCYPGE